MAVLGRDDDALVGKRPFFTTHGELLDEEYYDEQALEKKRCLKPKQVQMLERSFEEENKLEPEQKTELARWLGMAPWQLAVWFQNRRAQWKTKQLEADFDHPKAAYDSLGADHQGLLADNDRLRAQFLIPRNQQQNPMDLLLSTSKMHLGRPQQITILRRPVPESWRTLALNPCSRWMNIYKKRRNEYHIFCILLLNRS